jgi:hypothetical protein
MPQNRGRVFADTPPNCPASGNAVDGQDKKKFQGGNDAGNWHIQIAFTPPRFARLQRAARLTIPLWCRLSVCAG